GRTGVANTLGGGLRALLVECRHHVAQAVWDVEGDAPGPSNVVFGADPLSPAVPAERERDLPGSDPTCPGLPLLTNLLFSVPFSFDPNSAAGWLSVSSNLTSITNGSYKLLVDNPERFSSAPCILGSRGFSQGSHAWEVDLGGLTNWRVGVAKERGGSRRWNFHHDARSGFWYIYRLQGADSETCRASNAARSETALRDLKRIRVELDCDDGELSFYDADQKSHIYTFHEQFSGEVFPYFYVGNPKSDTPPGSLRICPLRVLIKEDLPL
ncbi:E3 ubiquitin-protein ligase TRIM35-like, partial [Macrochelys suwanniensis]